VHLFVIAQSLGSLGLFIGVCLATAALLTLAMVGLARMERATVPARVPTRPEPPRRAPSPFRADSALGTNRVSSPGSTTFGPRR